MKYIVFFLCRILITLLRLLWLINVTIWVLIAATITTTWHLNLKWDMIKAIKQGAVMQKGQTFGQWLFGEGDVFDEMTVIMLCVLLGVPPTKKSDQ